MGPARIYPWRKMHRSRAPSIAPGTFFVAQSWADCITNMPGFDLRQARPRSIMGRLLRRFPSRFRPRPPAARLIHRNFWFVGLFLWAPGVPAPFHPRTRRMAPFEKVKWPLLNLVDY